MDGSAIMGSVVVGSWSDICEQLLVLDKFFGSRIEMKWLEDNFSYSDNTSNAFEREQHARAFILRSTQLEVNRVGHVVPRDVPGDTTIKIKISGCILLLQSWAWYQLLFLCPQVDAPYTLPLVQEMYEFDRVIQQFGFRKTISPSPQDIEAQCKVNSQGRIDED
ncbi:hypothetical protein J1N35_025093 [Gossypium stocksii]|uniref:Uncharacterized protein n=1 Tax=Gossypium stocksii TaxID=47602 RepID=A0A9D3ZVV9_9ROSI|nr:hypothetical protein J1N35_025093 [Gossypium stocksii]